MLEVEILEALRLRARLGKDELEFVARSSRTSGAPALGLTQIQSMPGGRQLACRWSRWRSRSPASWSACDERRRRAAAAARRRCRRRSGAPAARRRPATWRRRLRPGRSRWRTCRRPAPSVPTKSVSQKGQMALARSSSRPDQRLHPAKRQNTAGRPVFAPSPCKV